MQKRRLPPFEKKKTGRTEREGEKNRKVKRSQRKIYDGDSYSGSSSHSKDLCDCVETNLALVTPTVFSTMEIFMEDHSPRSYYYAYESDRDSPENRPRFLPIHRNDDILRCEIDQPKA